MVNFANARGVLLSTGVCFYYVPPYGSISFFPSVEVFDEPDSKMLV